MRNTIRCIAIVASLFFCYNNAQAGEFTTRCFSDSEDIYSKCGSHISDIVTNKFLAKYPNNRWHIFVHSTALNLTSGGGVAYAAAGVVPRSTNEFPKKRYTAVTSKKSNNQLGIVDLHNLERETFRDAVTNLMQNCEVSPNCDLYAPNKEQL